MQAPRDFHAPRLSWAVVAETAHPARARWLLDVLAVAAAYIVAALLRLVFPFTEHGASWVWLPSGVALASLLLLGRDRWPGIFIGALVSSVLSDKQVLPALVAACYAPGEALLAYAIATRGGGFERDLGSVRSVLRLFLAAVVASAVTALVGAWNVGMLTPVPDPDYARAWLTFFVGDALGMLSVAPPLLVWGSTRVRFTPNWRRVEFAGLLAVAFVTGTVVFAQSTWPPTIVLPVAYVTFPIMVWSAFRFGQPGVTAVIVRARHAHALGQRARPRPVRPHHSSRRSADARRAFERHLGSRPSSWRRSSRSGPGRRPSIDRPRRASDRSCSSRRRWRS